MGLSAAGLPTKCPYVNQFSKCFYLRINSCMDDDMHFTGCRDVIGTPVSFPKPNMTLKKYDVFEIMVNAPGETTATMGNCTFEYTNANGKWVAFFDWYYAPIGDNTVGAGTNDVIDKENTVQGKDKRGGSCFWLMYFDREAWDDCYFNTNDTLCEREATDLQNPVSQVRSTSSFKWTKLV